jgi:hypothetical protein
LEEYNLRRPHEELNNLTLRNGRTTYYKPGELQAKIVCEKGVLTGLLQEEQNQNLILPFF